MKVLINILVLFFLSSLAYVSNAQVSIVEDANVSQVLNKYKTLNSQQTSINAWRIQVVTTNDRREMENAIVKLGHKYPNLKHHWIHASPYYQLKVGAFEEKADLQNLLIALKQDFRSAIPVKDEMEKSELIN